MTHAQETCISDTYTPTGRINCRERWSAQRYGTVSTIVWNATYLRRQMNLQVRGITVKVGSKDHKVNILNEVFPGRKGVEGQVGGHEKHVERSSIRVLADSRLALV